MQVSSEEIIFLIGLTSVIFLIAPLFLIIYINLYNSRKKAYAEEKASLQKTFENELLKMQMEVQEQTLRTIAYDLHDNIGQLLSLTSITLGSINLADTQKIGEKVEAADELTKRSIKELRALSRILHGEELLTRGLANAIEFELQWLGRSEVYAVNFTHNFVSVAGQSNKEIIIFRLFQEILNNIIRHSEASVININLQQSSDTVTLTMADNGKGFNVEETMNRQNGMGLNNIQKRAAMILGTASFASVKDEGTTVTIIIPYGK